MAESLLSQPDLWRQLFALVLAATVVMGSPGPATISVTAVGAAFGLRRSLRYACGIVLGTIAAMLALQYAPREPGLRLQAWISTWHPVPMGLAGALGLFVIATLGPQGVAPFIYFQF